MKTAMKNTAQYRRARSTARPRCQRFTFKAVRDTEGESLYYLILPYLKLSGDVEGFYREEYHLSVTESGEIYICTPSTGTCTAKCHWYLPSDIAGTDVKNGSKSGSIGLNLDTGTVEMVQSYDYSTGLWQIMPICLNIETVSQEAYNTCGASSSTMVLNYLLTQRTVSEEDFLIELTNKYGSSDSKKLSYDCVIINEYLAEEGSLRYKAEWFSSRSESFLNEKLSLNLNAGYPVTVQMISFEEDCAITGYYSSDDGHYIVAKGIYYNPLLNQYEIASNDCHYKYGPPIPNRNNCHDIGGRDLVVSSSQYFKLYNQRYGGLCYVL